MRQGAAADRAYLCVEHEQAFKRVRILHRDEHVVGKSKAANKKVIRTHT